MEEFPYEAYYRRIGRNIRRLRREKGLTQEALAEEARIVTDAVAGSSEEAHQYALKAIQYLQRDALITVSDVESALNS